MRLKKHILAVLIFTGLSASAEDKSIIWDMIEDGLYYSRIDYNQSESKLDSSLHVLKIDPGKWDFMLATASEMNTGRNLTVKEWCKRYGFTAGINAGMYDIDYSRHIGLLQNFDHRNNPSVHSKYQSAAAFNPKSAGAALFRIFDLDVTAAEDVIGDYNTIVQNLRLIKKPGQNRWQQQDKKWSEAALAEDKNGNALFILCNFPLSMHDFNEMILACPLDIAAAQHLEGGVEAQLYFSHGDWEIDVNGGFDSGMIVSSGAGFKKPVPNIIGIKKKQ